MSGKGREDINALILIPVYNHAGTLREIVAESLRTGLDVLVVDDGSTDGAASAIMGLSCKILRLERNLGKGAAILAGVRLASQWGYDAVITLDADGQHYPSDALRLLAVVREGKRWPVVVIGEREGMDGTDVPRSSRFGMRFSNFWVYIECGMHVRDSQSGFRLYPVHALLSLKIDCLRYDFEIEALVKLIWAGIPVKGVPVRCLYQEGSGRISHFHMIKDNLRLTRLHARLVLKRLFSVSGSGHIVRHLPEAIPSILDSLRHPVEFFKFLCAQHSTPAMLAASVWMGLFVGALPLIACHTVAIIYMAHRLHLNKVAAVAASQFCCPPVVPLLCIETGFFLRHGRPLTELTLHSTVGELHLRILDWFLGSLLVGPLLGLLGGALTYAVAVGMRQDRNGYV